MPIKKVIIFEAEEKNVITKMWQLKARKNELKLKMVLSVYSIIC